MHTRRPTTIPATAIVSTKNEAAAISDCLRSLAPFDQVIVVDSVSTDATVELATSFAGVEVVVFEWNGSYPKKKQWCLDNLDMRHDWVFWVDADERPTDGLLREIEAVVSADSSTRALDIPLRYFFMGKELRHGHRVFKRSLIHRKYTHYPVIDDLQAPGMGELEGHYQPIVDGTVRQGKHSLIHDDPDPLSDWISRHNKYSDWEAYLRSRPQLRENVRQNRSRGGMMFELAPFKPVVFFLYSYVVRLGFLDGRPGFAYAASLAWYYWTVGLKQRALEGRV